MSPLSTLIIRSFICAASLSISMLFSLTFSSASSSKLDFLSAACKQDRKWRHQHCWRNSINTSTNQKRSWTCWTWSTFCKPWFLVPLRTFAFTPSKLTMIIFNGVILFGKTHWINKCLLFPFLSLSQGLKWKENSASQRCVVGRI